MLRLQFLIVAILGNALGSLNGFLRFEGKFVKLHGLLLISMK